MLAGCKWGIPRKPRSPTQPSHPCGSRTVYWEPWKGTCPTMEDIWEGSHTRVTHIQSEYSLWQNFGWSAGVPLEEKLSQKNLGQRGNIPLVIQEYLRMVGGSVVWLESCKLLFPVLLSYKWPRTLYSFQVQHDNLIYADIARRFPQYVSLTAIPWPSCNFCSWDENFSDLFS